jgi:hypothetical protein
VTILNQDGTPYTPLNEWCDHGIEFDPVEARKVLDKVVWAPSDPVSFVMGNPACAEIRKRWPRLQGTCPKGCGFVGIAYASPEHYIAGDW